MTDFITTELLLYVLLGLAAQLVDGALGMAYGLIVTSTLLATGQPPAVASAAVHAAEVVTTGLAGGSHVWHKNVDWKLFVRLAPAGVIGGVLGAYVLVGLPETWVKIFVSLYLLALTVIITRRVMAEPKKSRKRHRRPGKETQVIPIGAAGGFLDAIGGGGWGPIVTSTLIVRGDNPRKSIGSSSLSEFFVTMAVSAALFVSLDFIKYLTIVVGLIIGGAIGAPFAGWFSKVIPMRWLMIMVAVVIGFLALSNIGQIIYRYLV
jgi:uncharacterized membrane protein YfcA